MKENFTSFFSDIALQNSFLLIMSTSGKVLKYTAPVRGFHYYQRIWSPKKGEKFNCYHERNNAFDVFAMKTEFANGSTVGHLPRDISRITKFMFDRGAKITAILSSTNYRRSPLVQGGLGIACEITVKMPATIKSHVILDRYKELINDYYSEPRDEEILGSFLAIDSHGPPGRPKEATSERKKKKRSNPERNLPDIRAMFRSQIRRQEGNHGRQKNDNKVVVIE